MKISNGAIAAFAQRQSITTFQPSQALAPYVQQYIFCRLRSWHEEGHTGLILPTENSTIVLGPDIRCQFGPVNTPPGRSMHSSGSFLLGPHYRSMEVHIPAREVNALVIILKPGTLQLLTGIPLLKLQTSVLNLSALNGRLRTSLLRIDPTEASLQTIHVLEEILLYLVGRSTESSLERFNSVRHLIANVDTGTRGRYTLESFYEACTLSPKSLERFFSRYVGLLPKQYLRVKRLHAVFRKLEAGAISDWQQLARETGYHDYSHFYKDTKDLIGSSPRSIPEKLKYRQCALSQQIASVTLS